MGHSFLSPLLYQTRTPSQRASNQSSNLFKTRLLPSAATYCKHPLTLPLLLSPSISVLSIIYLSLSLSLSLSLFPLSIDWAQQSYSCHPERGMNRRPPTEWLNFDRIPFLEPLGPLLRQTRPQSDSERYLERSTFNKRSINGKVFTKN